MTYALDTWQEQDILTLPEKYVGFCKGDLANDQTLAFPSGEHGFVLAKIIKTEDSVKLKLLSSIIKTEGCGMVTSLKFACIKNIQCIFTTYENGTVLLWEIVNSSDDKLVSVMCQVQYKPEQ